MGLRTSMVLMCGQEEPWIWHDFRFYNGSLGCWAELTWLTMEQKQYFVGFYTDEADVDDEDFYVPDLAYVAPEDMDAAALKCMKAIMDRRAEEARAASEEE